MNPPELIYQMIAYSFMGFETNWCIQNGNLNFVEPFFSGMNAILLLDTQYEDSVEKYINP